MVAASRDGTATDAADALVAPHPSAPSRKKAGSSMTDELLSDAEAASMLRCSRATVRRERLEGRLGFVQVRGRYFYRQSQVTQYIDGMTVQESTTQCQPTVSVSIDLPARLSGMSHGQKKAEPGSPALARQTAKKLKGSSRRSVSNTKPQPKRPRKNSRSKSSSTTISTSTPPTPATGLFSRK